MAKEPEPKSTGEDQNRSGSLSDYISRRLNEEASEKAEADRLVTITKEVKIAEEKQKLASHIERLLNHPQIGELFRRFRVIELLKETQKHWTWKDATIVPTFSSEEPRGLYIEKTRVTTRSGQSPKKQSMYFSSSSPNDGGGYFKSSVVMVTDPSVRIPVEIKGRMTIEAVSSESPTAHPYDLLYSCTYPLPYPSTFEVIFTPPTRILAGEQPDYLMKLIGDDLIKAQDAHDPIRVRQAQRTFMDKLLYGDKVPPR